MSKRRFQTRLVEEAEYRFLCFAGRGFTALAVLRGLEGPRIVTRRCWVGATGEPGFGLVASARSNGPGIRELAA
jgi:hypothetical protein